MRNKQKFIFTLIFVFIFNFTFIPTIKSTAINSTLEDTSEEKSNKKEKNIEKHEIEYSESALKILPVEAKDSIYSSLSYWPAEIPEIKKFYIHNIIQGGNWLIGQAMPREFPKNIDFEDDPHYQIRNTVTFFMFKESSSWKFFYKGDKNMKQHLDKVDEKEVDTETKRLLLQSISYTIAQQSYTNYKFPWPSDTNFSVTPWRHRKLEDWHGSNSNALDFIPSNKETEILSLANGKITDICKNPNQEQAWIEITTEGTSETFIIMHLKRDSIPTTLELYSTVRQGDFLGKLFQGIKDERDKQCPMNVDGTHLHLGFPTKPFTIDGYTFSTVGNTRELKLIDPSGNAISYNSPLPSTNGIALKHFPQRNIMESGNWQILAPADVNKDKLDDLIAFNKVTTEVKVILSSGTSLGTGYRDAKTWNSKTFYGHPWVMLDPADVNGDEAADLIAFNTETTAVAVTLSTGVNFGGGYDGVKVWNTNTKYNTTDWIMLPPKNVDNDKAADLIAFNPTSRAVNVTPSTRSNFGGGNEGYRIWNRDTKYSTTDWILLDSADVNNDNRTDLIAFNPSTTAVDVTLSNGTNFGGGDGGYQVWNRKTYYSTPAWTLLPPRDVTGDNRADLIAVDKSSNTVDITPATTNNNFGNGDGGAQIWNTSAIMTNGWNILPCSFMSNDRSADFITFDTNSSEVKVFNSNSLNFQEGTIWNEYTTYINSNWINLRPADVDGDGDSDLIKFDKVTTKVEVIPSTGYNFGGGSEGFVPWNRKTWYGGDWVMLDPSDADGDGDADLIAFNTSTTAIYVTPSTRTNFGGGEGGSEKWNEMSYYGTSVWKLLSLADVDDDGDEDIIAFNKNSTAVDVSLADPVNKKFSEPKVWNTQTYYGGEWVMLDPANVNSEDNMADLIAFNPVTMMADVTLSTGSNFGGGHAGAEVWNKNTYYGGSWVVINPADVNRDKKADLMAFNTSTSMIDVTLSTGSNFGGGEGGAEVWSEQSYYGISAWELWPSSDVDGDRDADLIAFNRNTTMLDVSLNDHLLHKFGNPQVWNTNIDR